MFIAVCNEGIKAKDVKKEINKIIQDIKDGKITKEELNKIKINTKADFIFSLESSDSVASLYGSYFVRNNVKPLFEYEEKVEKLKKKDIIGVAKKYLTTKNSTTLILKPEKNK
jgi:predicted Zn-dependent peptidase